MKRIIAVTILSLLAAFSWAEAGSSTQRCLMEEDGALGQKLTAGDYASVYAALLPLAELDCAEEQFTLGTLMYHGKYDFTVKARKLEQEEGYNWLLRAASNGIDRAPKYLAAIRKNGWAGFAKNLELSDCWSRAYTIGRKIETSAVNQCLEIEKKAPLW